MTLWLMFMRRFILTMPLGRLFIMMLCQFSVGPIVFRFLVHWLYDGCAWYRLVQLVIRISGSAVFFAVSISRRFLGLCDRLTVFWIGHLFR